MGLLRRLCGVALLLGAAPAAGQQPFVTGVRSLSFGLVLPGVPSSVLRTDPTNSGYFTIGSGGQQGQSVQLTFTLPAALGGPAGATMPLTFTGTSAGFSATGAIGSQVTFDPRRPFVTQLGQAATSAVFIGGTVNPSPSQPAGGYSATLTLTVAFLQ